MFARLLHTALGAVAQLALLAPLATAQGTPAATPGGKFAAPAATAAPTPIGTGSSVLQIFGSLAVVIATILVIGWIARRLRQTPRSRNSALRVIDEIAVGNKERVVLLEVDGMRLVLGVGDGRVAILHRTASLSAGGNATDSGNVAAGGSKLPTSTAGGERFVELLRRSLGK